MQLSPAFIRMICPTVVLCVLSVSQCAWGQRENGNGSELRAQSSQLSKPNIVFIFADDQCYDTIRALGNNEIRTPNLDRLVESGTTFTHAYNMGAWSPAVCMPSRTMLNTGRFLWRTQPRDNQREDVRLFEQGKLWSQLMAAAGYDTYFTGKWHIAPNPAKAFQFTRHVRPGMPKDVPEGYNRPLENEPDPWTPWDPKWGGYWEGGEHWSEVLRKDACDFIEQAAERNGQSPTGRPFFMYLAFNAPHDPRQSPREYVERYPVDRISLPANFLPVYPFAADIGCGPDLRDERLAPFPRTPHAVRVHRREYYSIITHMDTQIGMILDAIQRAGLDDNTYVLFTADHGLAVGQHGLIGKQNLFEHSMRPPLMITGAGIPTGRRIHAPVYLQDVMPTSLELAGADRPEHVEFKSLLPLVDGRRDRSYDAIYGAYLDLQRAVIQNNHKLILYPGIGKMLLFDLATDPHEMNNLADDPDQAPTIRRLFATLLRLQEETGDRLDLKSAYPNLRS